MNYNPAIHHRRSIRLKGYDYSQKGMYFITICVQNRDYLFGRIVIDVGADLRVCPNIELPLGKNKQDEKGEKDEHIEKGEKGKYIEKGEKGEKGEHIGSFQPPLQPPFEQSFMKSSKMILNDAGKMIEKWYCKLENKFPDIKCGEFVIMPNHFHCIIINIGHVNTVGADMHIHPINVFNKINYDKSISNENMMGEYGEHILGEHLGSPLRQIVQWFKTMSTNEYIRGVKTFDWRRFDGKLWQRNYWEHIIQDDRAFESISRYIINNPNNWGKDKLR